MDKRIKDTTEYIGKVYGKWTVIDNSFYRSKNRDIYVLARCVCGNEKPVSLRNLLRGISKSCGCSTKEFIIKTRDVVNEVGNKYGRLLVIDRAERRGNWDIAYWNCICDCGNLCLASGHNLRLGRKRSCGCLNPDIQRERNTKYPEEVIITKIMTSYKRGAKRRNLEFRLDREEIKKLIFNNCSYCDKEPTNIFNEFKNKTIHEPIKYNGIDRVDNSRGYVTDNVVTCCMYCNMAKRDMSLDDFKNMIKRIYNKLCKSSVSPIQVD